MTYALPRPRGYHSFVLALASATLLTACAAQPRSAEPSGPAPAAGQVPREAPPVYALLGQRERLALTSEQITRLDSIGRWVDSANATALARLRERGVGPELPAEDAGGVADRTPADVRDARTELIENNRAALRAVESLLTDDQRARVCEIFPPEGDRGSRGRGGPRPPGTRSPLPGSVGRYPWPWCVPQLAA